MDQISLNSFTPKQTADGSWTLFHPIYGEEFHSRDGAWQETDLLYMQKSGFSAWLQQPDVASLAVLDVGLGLGYNALACIGRWMAAPNPPSLTLISLERDPELVATLASGSLPWGREGFSEQMLGWCRTLRTTGTNYQATLSHPSGASLDWQVIVADASELRLSDLGVKHKFGFIFQDAFSPRKNPELWTTAWFRQIAELSRDDAVLVTYSAARLVRDNLTAAGWKHERLAASANKKHWLRATYSQRNNFQVPSENTTA